MKIALFVGFLLVLFTPTYCFVYRRWIRPRIRKLVNKVFEKNYDGFRHNL